MLHAKGFKQRYQMSEQPNFLITLMSAGIKLEECVVDIKLRDQQKYPIVVGSCFNEVSIVLKPLKQNQ